MCSLRQTSHKSVTCYRCACKCMNGLFACMCAATVISRGTQAAKCCEREPPVHVCQHVPRTCKHRTLTQQLYRPALYEKCAALQVGLYLDGAALCQAVVAEVQPLIMEVLASQDDLGLADSGVLQVCIPTTQVLQLRKVCFAALHSAFMQRSEQTASSFLMYVIPQLQGVSFCCCPYDCVYFCRRSATSLMMPLRCFCNRWTCCQPCACHHRCCALIFATTPAPSAGSRLHSQRVMPRALQLRCTCCQA